MTRRFLTLSVLLLPLLLAAGEDPTEAPRKKRGCKKKAPEVVQNDGDGTVVKPVKQDMLQTASFRPSLVEPDKAFKGTVFGSGFRDGAMILLDDAHLRGVVFVDKNTLEVEVPGKPSGTYDVTVRNPDGDESTLFNALQVASPTSDSCRHVRVFFDIDKAGLSNEARKVLDDNITCYRDARGEVVVEGHADERGTTDYNLALGQRRAETVKRHITGQGVPPGRVPTVSYGEERPLDKGHDERAWAQNRRADVRLIE